MTIGIFAILFAASAISQCAESKLLRKSVDKKTRDDRRKVHRKLKIHEDGDVLFSKNLTDTKMFNYSSNNNDYNNNNNKQSCVPEQIPKDKSTCWQWNVDGVKYDYNKQQKGCDHKLCEEAVCNCDPYCCTTSWDLSCRGFQVTSNDKSADNFHVNGCSASLLCCEPITAYPKPPLPHNPIPIRPSKPNYYQKCEKQNWTPPDDSTCWKWNVVQNNTSMSITKNNLILQKGCDYKLCQDVVCDCDSYCCDVSWDLSCRGVQMSLNAGNADNYFSPGCSASILCCESDAAYPKAPLPPVRT